MLLRVRSLRVGNREFHLSQAILRPGSVELPGRDHELAWLGHCSEAAARGQPRLVVVQGETGIGKTRLLKAALPVARELGISVGLGRGYEDLSIPYLGVMEMFRSLPERSDPDHSLLDLFEPAGGSPAETEGNERARLFLRVSERLLERAEKHPFLLAVDDFQWLDPPSRALLSHLVFAVSDARLQGACSVMLLITSRPLRSESPARRTLERLKREPFAEQLDVKGLDAHATARLITALEIPHPSSKLVSVILERTAGNPLFVEALVREIIRTDSLRTVEGDSVLTVDPSDLDLPVDVTQALRDQVQSLGGSCRAILELASLVGSTLDPIALAAAAEVATGAVDAALDEAGALLQPPGPSREFAQPLVRHVLSHGISPDRRAELHRRIAEVLMASGGPRDGPDTWEVVRHLMAAGAKAHPGTLFELGSRAGRWAEGLCAWCEAAEAYGAAAAVAPDAERRAPLHFRAARCFMKSYDHGLRRQHDQLALADFRELGDDVGAARVVSESARSDLFQLPLGELRDLTPIRNALAELTEDEIALRGALMARLADAYFYARDSKRGIEHARQALELGERCGDRSLCADGCISQGLALHQAGQLEAAAESFERGLDHVRASGDRWLECGLRVRHASVLHGLGRLGQARTQLVEALAAARAENDMAEEAFAQALLAGIEAAEGNFARAEQHAQEALRLHARLERRPWAPMLAIPALAYGRFLRGDWNGADDALAALDEPGRILDEVGAAVHGMTRIYRAYIRSMSPTAMPELGEDVADLLEHYGKRVRPGRADGSALGVVCALVELAEQTGRMASVEAPLEVLREAAGSGAQVGNGWPTSIPRVLAVAALARDELDLATTGFESALEASEAIHRVPERARTQLDFARMLVARGSYADERRARDLIEEACAAFSRLDMSPFLERARNLADGLGMAVPPTPPERAGLGPRDLDLLKRLARGNGERKIGGDLLMRPETAAEEIRALLDRLGLAGSKEAAAYAVEHGLIEWGEGNPPRTVLVTDLEGFTHMVERLGDEAAQRVIQLHNRLLRMAIQEHSGTEITHTGDGLIASFRATVEAIACAIAIQARFDAHNRAEEPPLRLRIGLHTGRPRAEEGRLFGTAVNTAVRICGRAAPATILASRRVHAEARGLTSRFAALGQVRLKGLSQPIELFQVEWRDPELEQERGVPR